MHYLIYGKILTVTLLMENCHSHIFYCPAIIKGMAVGTFTGLGP